MFINNILKYRHISILLSIPVENQVMANFGVNTETDGKTIDFYDQLIKINNCNCNLLAECDVILHISQ